MISVQAPPTHGRSMGEARELQSRTTVLGASCRRDGAVGHGAMELQSRKAVPRARRGRRKPQSPPMEPYGILAHTLGLVLDDKDLDGLRGKEMEQVKLGAPCLRRAACSWLIKARRPSWQKHGGACAGEAATACGGGTVRGRMRRSAACELHGRPWRGAGCGSALKDGSLWPGNRRRQMESNHQRIGINCVRSMLFLFVRIFFVKQQNRRRGYCGTRN